MNDIRNPASDAANKFCDETQHVELNATDADADTIIRNIRFMAYASGWSDGDESGRNVGRIEGRQQERLRIWERLGDLAGDGSIQESAKVIKQIIFGGGDVD